MVPPHLRVLHHRRERQAGRACCGHSWAARGKIHAGEHSPNTANTSLSVIKVTMAQAKVDKNLAENVAAGIKAFPRGEHRTYTREEPNSLTPSELGKFLACMFGQFPQHFAMTYKLPTRLQTALEALYGHYEKTFKLWEDKGIKVPPCFIIVCQNTAISKLVYDYVSGFVRKNDDGTSTLVNGRLALFRNFDESTLSALPRPNTLLIDSEQLEAGDALDDNFRVMASDEIERFRRERVERTGDARSGETDVL